MIAKDFIDKDIPALSINDDVGLALKYMEEEKPT